jgi:hypothetical protein
MNKNELMERLTFRGRGYWGAPVVKNKYVTKARERQIIEAARDHAFQGLVKVARGIKISDAQAEDGGTMEDVIGEWARRISMDMPSGQAVFLAFDCKEFDAMVEAFGVDQPVPLQGR